MAKADLIHELFDAMTTLRRRMHGTAEEYLGHYNLTRPQIGLLFLLLHQSGLSVREIADQTGVTSGAATQTLDVMERRQLVVRKTDEYDRRVSRLSLSPAGEELAREIKTRHTAEMSRLLGELSEPELETLLTAVTKLSTLIKEPSHGDRHDQ